MPDLVVCVATDLEAEGFPGTGSIAGVSCELLCTGAGPVNAAMALTRYLAREPEVTVVSLGVGGAYPGSGLEVGEVACAATETYGDLGADSPEGFLDMERLGFPVVGEHFNELPLSRYPAPRRLPFVTRSTCTGRLEEALSIARRTGGAVESMEGAAIVHVALAHGRPVGELRGISNPVADRDRSAWRLREAARAAGSTLVRWIEEGAC